MPNSRAMMSRIRSRTNVATSHGARYATYGGLLLATTLVSKAYDWKRYGPGSMTRMIDVNSADGKRQERIAALVHDKAGIDAQQGAVVAHGDIKLQIFFARVRRRHQVLVAILDPLDGSTKMFASRGNRSIPGNTTSST